MGKVATYSRTISKPILTLTRNIEAAPQMHDSSSVVLPDLTASTRSLAQASLPRRIHSPSPSLPRAQPSLTLPHPFQVALTPFQPSTHLFRCCMSYVNESSTGYTSFDADGESQQIATPCRGASQHHPPSTTDHSSCKQAHPLARRGRHTSTTPHPVNLHLHCI